MKTKLFLLQKSWKKIIRIYQLFLSPLFGFNCRYYPTCSSYSLDAVEKYGFLKGIKMTFFRLLRCHPFSSSGYDPA